MIPAARRILVAAAACLACSVAGAAEPGSEEKPSGRTVLVLERTVVTYGLPPLTPGEAPPAGRKVEKLDERHYTVKMVPDLLRESCRESGEVTVVRLDRGVIWLMDTRENTYREISLASLRARSDQDRERLRRRLPLVDDPEVAARIRKLIAPDGERAKVSVERAGENRTIVGESCRPVVIRLGDDELFRGWISERSAPLADARWLALGGCFPRGAAKELASVRGLLIEGTFPMPGGGRLEISTQRLSEQKLDPGDFADPETLNFKSVDRAGERSGGAGRTGAGGK